MRLVLGTVTTTYVQEYATTLRAVAKKSICKYQNGFVWQRNFLNNPVARDAMARIFQTICPELDPAIVSWDFAAAFPSIGHECLFMVFRVNGMPEGMFQFARLIYFWVDVFANSCGTHVFLFQLLSGVIQVCPLAGLFAMAIDPVLRALAHVIDQPSPYEGIPQICSCSLR